MDIKEVKANLNKKVRHTNKHLGLDGEYILRACILRKDEKRGVFCQAEIQKDNAVYITSLNDIQAIEKECMTT